MAAVEATRQAHSANKDDEATENSRSIRLDTSAPAGPGRPSLTSPSLKRKTSVSRVDIDLANVNNTVSMFMGGRRHSWMQSGTKDAFAPRVPPPKRVKTTPSKSSVTERKPQASSEAPAASTSSHVPKSSPPRQINAEPVVITIPDTQPEEQEGLSTKTTATFNEPQSIHDPSSDSTLIASPPTSIHSTPDAVSSVQPVVQSPQTDYRKVSATAPIVLEQEVSPDIIRDVQASPVNEDISITREVSQAPILTRPSIVEQAPRTRPTVQTAISISTAYLQNVTPPPSTSPVSASVLNGVGELGLRSAHPSTAMPSPIASPQMTEPTSIDVPKYLPDGTCKMHTVYLQRPTIEDHNLLLGDLQRLSQQIKDSTLPNKSLLVRHSKLHRALETIRRQINQTTVQSTQDLVSDVLRRRSAPMAHNQPHAPSGSFSSQTSSTFTPTSASQSPLNRRVSIPQTGRQHSHAQLQPGAVPQNTMLPPPQPHQVPPVGHFRAPAPQSPQDPSLYAQTLPDQTTQPPPTSWPKIPQTSNNSYLPSQLQVGPQAPPPQSSRAQASRYHTQYANQQQVPGVSVPIIRNSPWSYNYVDKLHYLMAQPGTEPWKPNDSLRASLLENALKQGDDLFVALHLLFCSADHPSLKHKYSFIWEDPRNKLGLELLSQLLFANSSLSERALTIFVQIPMDLSAAGTKIEGFHDNMMTALKLLQDIRPIFDNLYNHCDMNKLPCPPAVLIANAGVSSPALQRTIGVSLSQMLKQYAKPSQTQPQTHAQVQPQPQPQTQLPVHQHSQAPTYRQMAQQAHMMLAAQNFPQAQATRKTSTGPGELSLLTTDWGGKVPSWKLVQEWRHVPADLQKPEGDKSNFYTYFKRCVTPVIRLTARPQQLSFLIEGALNKSYPRGNRMDGVPFNIRPVRNWSKLYRLRCVASKQDLSQLTRPDDYSSWRSQETCWPTSIFAELYDNQNRDDRDNSHSQDRDISKKRRLHFRRKRAWGKDCTTDLTDGLEHGENTIQAMVLDSPVGDGTSYYIAVEEVEVADYNTLFQLITQTQVLSSNDAKDKITSRLKRSADSIANDDEISVLEEDTVTVSVTCPMSQQLIDIPVRGKHCKHLDCFDLKGYLSSRTKFPTGFSVPDSWKCPICSCESTPATLIVDGFMKDTVAKMREVQAEGQYLNAKSVVIRSDGMWRPNEPPETSHTTKKIKKEMPEVISLLDDDDD